MGWYESIAAITGDADKWEWPLSDACHKYEINTDRRVEYWLAQIAHESGGFKFLREIWGPTAAQSRYEGRVDLGNTEPGDGKQFMGRGLIQITGRTNYRACGLALGLNLIASPELLEQPDHAAMSAAWFWASHGCNELADVADFNGVTRRINGGTTGMQSRVDWLDRVERAMLL